MQLSSNGVPDELVFVWLQSCKFMAKLGGPAELGGCCKSAGDVPTGSQSVELRDALDSRERGGVNSLIACCLFIRKFARKPEPQVDRRRPRTAPCSTLALDVLG